MMEVVLVAFTWFMAGFSLTWGRFIEQERGPLWYGRLVGTGIFTVSLTLLVVLVVAGILH